MQLLPMASSPDGLISARDAVITKTPCFFFWGGGWMRSTVSMDTVFSVGAQRKFAAAQYLGAVLHFLRLFFFRTERRLWYH